MDSGTGSTRRSRSTCESRTTGIACVLEDVPACIMAPVSPRRSGDDAIERSRNAQIAHHRAEYAPRSRARHSHLLLRLPRELPRAALSCASASRSRAAASSISCCATRLGRAFITPDEAFVRQPVESNARLQLAAPRLELAPRRAALRFAAASACASSCAISGASSSAISCPFRSRDRRRPRESPSDTRTPSRAGRFPGTA